MDLTNQDMSGRRISANVRNSPPTQDLPLTRLPIMRPSVSRHFRMSSRAISTAGGLLLAACAATGTQTAPSSPTALEKLLAGVTAPTSPAPAPQPGALPESSAPATAVEKGDCGSAAQCKSLLKAMIDDPKRTWVGRRPSPAAYVNGTRQFAYRALRKKLSCRELALALDELHAVANSTDSLPGATPAQISRTRALSTQVEAELRSERARRCRA